MPEPSLISDPNAVTAAWLTEAIRASGRARSASVRSFRSELVGTGQMGRNVRYHLDWDGDAGDDGDTPATVVGKFPSDDPKSRETGAAQGIYRKEVLFYRHVASTVDVRTPRCLLALVDDNGTDFVLLMEDLSPAVQGDQIAGCDGARATLALDELAKLHAPRWGDPSLYELEFLEGPSEERASMLGVIYQSLWPGFRDRYAERLDPDVLALTERLGPRLEAWVLGADGPQTVVHGDYRLDNMLFGTGPGAPPLTVVDWQTVGRAIGTGDASYFIGAGLPAEDRGAQEQDLLRGYHHNLCSRGVEGYDWDRCWHDYRYTTFGGLVVAVIASMIVEQTDRGDEMFVIMTTRHSRHALDLEAEELLR